MAAIAGQRTVTTAGAAVVLGATQLINGPLMVKALDTNTGVVAIGNDGANDVTVSNGMRLKAGDAIVYSFVGDLASLWIDSAVNGEGVCWAALAV